MSKHAQLKVSANKWLQAVCLIAGLAGVFSVIGMVHPSVGNAFTLIERPALVFPEITAQSNENIVLCTNNMATNASVQAVVGLVDVADSTRFLRGTTPVSASLDPQKGGCFLLLPAIHPTVDNAVLPARTGTPVIFIGGADANSATGGGGGAAKGLVSSVQLVGADGSVKVVTTPTSIDKMLLPAVQ